MSLIEICPYRASMKENSKCTSSNFVGSIGGTEQGSQHHFTDVTEVKLDLWSRRQVTRIQKWSIILHSMHNNVCIITWGHPINYPSQPPLPRPPPPWMRSSKEGFESYFSGSGYASVGYEKKITIAFLWRGTYKNWAIFSGTLFTFALFFLGRKKSTNLIHRGGY